MHDFPKFELKTQDLLNFGPNDLLHIFFSNICYDLIFQLLKNESTNFILVKKTTLSDKKICFLFQLRNIVEKKN